MMLPSKIKKIYRVISSGWCYATFGIGAIVLFLGIFPIVDVLSIGNPVKRRKYLKKIVSGAFSLFVKQLSVLGGISVTISKEDRQKLKALKGVVLVANHPSLLDIVILLSLVGEGDCVVAGKLIKNIYFGRVVKKVYIPNTGDTDHLMEKCNQSLAEGNTVIIFPEGTRTTPGEPLHFTRGAANIALRCQRDVVPVHITCEPSGISKTVKWYTVTPERMRYTFKVLPAIQIQAFLEQEEESSLASRRLTAKMEAILSQYA